MSQTVIAQLCYGPAHQGFSNFFVLRPILKLVFLCDPLMDSRYVDAVMTFNFENAAPHMYAMQKSKRL